MDSCISPVEGHDNSNCRICCDACRVCGNKYTGRLISKPTRTSDVILPHVLDQGRRGSISSWKGTENKLELA
jgi:hypothetical protein